MIMKEKGFFLSLEPIDGAIETVKRLSKNTIYGSVQNLILNIKIAFWKSICG